MLAYLNLIISRFFISLFFLLFYVFFCTAKENIIQQGLNSFNVKMKLIHISLLSKINLLQTLYKATIFTIFEAM